MPNHGESNLSRAIGKTFRSQREENRGRRRQRTMESRFKPMSPVCLPNTQDRITYRHQTRFVLLPTTHTDLDTGEELSTQEEINKLGIKDFCNKYHIDSSNWNI